MDRMNKTIKKWAMGLLVASVLGAIATQADGPLTSAMNLGVKTDSNGYLLTTFGAYVAADGPLTALGNIKLRTDSNGYLIVTPGASGTFTIATVNATTGYQVSGINRIAYVTSDFTTANNTNLQAITGLTWTLPVTTALVVPFRCTLFYSQATAAVSSSFGVQTDTVTPTNFQAGGSMETALGTTAYGDVTIANTTATAVVTGTPSATATVFNAYVDGLLENPSNASTTTLTIQVKTSVGADAITVKRGSFCRAF